MKNSQQNPVLAFYSLLLQVFLAENFLEKKAEQLVHMSKKYSKVLTLQAFTLKELRLWHSHFAERHDTGMEIAVTITEACFIDFATQIRNPADQQVFMDWKKASETERDLYVHVRKVLNHKGGFGDVQTVCDDFERLLRHYEDSDEVSTIHLSGVGPKKKKIINVPELSDA